MTMWRSRRRAGLPGFGLALDLTLCAVALVVVLPLAALGVKAGSLGSADFWRVVTAPRVVASYGLSFGAALAAAVINGVCGPVVAWVLIRYRFPGRRLLDALVDLPFALPTAVAGISLTTLYAPNGWLGAPLERLGIRVAFTRLGIVVALTFISLPFVVRALAPVIESLDAEVEEAALTLGASRAQIFLRVLTPALLPAWFTGFVMALARALGEYGSVVFIAGNLPGKTEIAPLLIMTRLDQYDYAGAAAIGVVMLGASLGLLCGLGCLQSWSAHASRSRSR